MRLVPQPLSPPFNLRLGFCLAGHSDRAFRQWLLFAVDPKFRTTVAKMLDALALSAGVSNTGHSSQLSFLV